LNKIPDDVKIIAVPLWSSDPELINLGSRYKKPGYKDLESSKFYPLGTDQLGRDVFAGVLVGASYSFWIGFFSMLIALTIGIILGFLSGWHSYRPLKMSFPGTFVLGLIALTAICFIFLVFRYYIITGADPAMLTPIFVFTGFILALTFLLFKYERQIPVIRRKYHVPVDSIISRSIEVLSTLPVILIALGASAILLRHSILSLVLIIGILRWPMVARYTRAETLRLAPMAYAELSRRRSSSGLIMIVRDLLPNMFAPLMAIFAFGIASTVILEAGLSFLGLGLGVEKVTWGSQLASISRNPDAWWVAFFPGIVLLMILMALNFLGQSYLSGKGGAGRSIKWY
jgi:peptide/nickel transport system permease protein